MRIGFRQNRIRNRAREVETVRWRNPRSGTYPHLPPPLQPSGVSYESSIRLLDTTFNLVRSFSVDYSNYGFSEKDIEYIFYRLVELQPSILHLRQEDIVTNLYGLTSLSLDPYQVNLVSNLFTFSISKSLESSLLNFQTDNTVLFSKFYNLQENAIGLHDYFLNFSKSYSIITNDLGLNTVAQNSFSKFLSIGIDSLTLTTGNITQSYNAGYELSIESVLLLSYAGQINRNYSLETLTSVFNESPEVNFQKIVSLQNEIQSNIKLLENNLNTTKSVYLDYLLAKFLTVDSLQYGLQETITVLDSFESEYAVGRQHVHFNIRNSSLSSGTIRQSSGEWHVIRGNNIISSEYDVLDFSWVGMDGDIVYVRCIDESGNKGTWVSYIFSVSSNYSYTQYVDATIGSNSNDGLTSGAPVQTIEQARINMAANLSADQVGVVYVKEGQVHSYNTTAVWTGGSTKRLVRFVRWGNSTSQPTLQGSGTGAAIFTSNNNDSIHFEGLIIDCGGGPISGAIRIQQSSTRYALNMAILDCTIKNSQPGLIIENTSIDYTNRRGGSCDFFSIDNTIFEDTMEEYALYNSCPLRYVHINNVTMGDTLTAVNVFRVTKWEHFSIRDFTITRSDGASVRFQSTSTGTDDGIFYGSISRLKLLGTDWLSNAIGFGQTAPATSGHAIIKDVRLVDCWALEGIIGAKFTGTHTADLDCIQFWRCLVSGGRLVVDVTSTSGSTVNNIEFRNNCIAKTAADDGAIVLGGPATMYTSNGVSITSCIAWWNVNGHFSDRWMVRADGMTDSELSSILSECDYNHAGKTDGAYGSWWAITSSNYHTFASWQSATGLDSNSSFTASLSSMGWTNNGTIGSYMRDIDVTHDGTGPQSGTGKPRSYSLDSAIFIRSSSTPDAGPYEHSATQVPDKPSVNLQLNVVDSVMLENNELPPP